MKNCRFKDKRLLVFYPSECAALTSYTISCLFKLITLLHALALQNAIVSRLILHSVRCGFSFKSINYAETDFNHEMNNEVTNGTVLKNINQNLEIRFNHRSRAIRNSNKKIPEMNIAPRMMHGFIEISSPPSILKIDFLLWMYEDKTVRPSIDGR